MDPQILRRGIAVRGANDLPQRRHPGIRQGGNPLMGFPEGPQPGRADSLRHPAAHRTHDRSLVTRNRNDDLFCKRINESRRPRHLSAPRERVRKTVYKDDGPSWSGPRLLIFSSLTIPITLRRPTAGRPLRSQRPGIRVYLPGCIRRRRQ